MSLDHGDSTFGNLDPVDIQVPDWPFHRQQTNSQGGIAMTHPCFALGTHLLHIGRTLSATDHVARLTCVCQETREPIRSAPIPAIYFSAKVGERQMANLRARVTHRMKVPDQLACKLKHAMVEGYEVMKALLDDTGRIRVPDRVQADWGVKVGDELAWEEENGRWFLEAAGSKSAGAEQASGPDNMANSVTPRDRCAPSAVASDRDELNWEDMDYESLPLRRVGQVRFRIKRRGRLQPMPHDLDEE